MGWRRETPQCHDITTSRRNNYYFSTVATNKPTFNVHTCLPQYLPAKSKNINTLTITMASSQTMRAVVQPDYTKAEIAFAPSVPVPTVTTEDGHLIRVSYTSPTLNELNWAPFNMEAFNAKPTHVPCYDFSGTVVSGPTSSPYQAGAKVFGRVEAYRQGTAAEYTIAKTSEIAAAPKTLDGATACVVPMSSITAWQAIFTAETAQNGKGILDARAITAPEGSDERSTALAANGKVRVLVTGASGGVGLWVLQLARAAGVKEVIAVARGKKLELVREYGATETIDTAAQSIQEWVSAGKDRKVDLVVDLVGKELLTHGWYAVKSDGVLLSIVMPPQMVQPTEGAVEVGRAEFFILEPLGEQLAHVAKLIDAGKCKTQIDSVFELEEAAKAFEKVEKGRPIGKVVIKVAGDE